ncbi:dTDP-glucose 4,6-dehydratase [Roseivivax jejudonensis]|uniref:dTDP-glucose 4,6-dehydratase n=2 Tax=Roseivivax jejudonensis TaxID=1529041 RepID=A0A1X6Y466_9RHOB|nr:dTDP-glucose 4,6-dehydratase [Roseivivax jejudonensis]
MMRSRLSHMADTIRLSDVSDMEPAGDGEEVVQCDLADEAAVHDLVKDCDGIVHFGGVSVEQPFDPICAANIRGVYNIYEAARAHGMPRILFASSNHTIGYYTQDQHLGVDDPMKPDGLYGVSKCFGEAMASMYHSKFGQETAIVRIGSCFPEPKNHRMLATWFSPDDFVALIECVFRASRIGCPIVWGVSDNEEQWWDNSAARFLGWRPKDSSARFRDKVDAEHKRPPADDPNAVYQGGAFTAEPIHRD